MSQIVNAERGPANLHDRLAPLNWALPILETKARTDGGRDRWFPRKSAPQSAAQDRDDSLGIGIERWPAAVFGLPSTSFPPTWVIERRTRIRRAFRSTSSTLSPSARRSASPYRSTATRRRRMVRMRGQGRRPLRPSSRCARLGAMAGTLCERRGCDREAVRFSAAWSRHIFKTEWTHRSVRGLAPPEPSH
jgi:hypothetical protein